MRSYDDLKRILELWEQGHNKLKIAKMTGIPRGTVRDAISRYGSVANLDAVMSRNDFLPTDAPQRLERREYTIASFKPKPRRYLNEELAQAVAESLSMAEVLRKLNLRAAGGNYDIVKRKIKEFSLDTSHFTGQGWSKGKQSPFIRHRALEEILVENSTYVNTTHLRQRLLAEGIFEHRCVSCGLAEWLERPIPLEIDHINGDRRDNLRLLCPNCHALTTTYRGKNKKNSTEY